MKMLVTYFALCVVLFSRATSVFTFPVTMNTIRDVKVLHVNLVHQFDCEKYNHLEGMKAEVVNKGYPDPVPVFEWIKDYVHLRCQMMNPYAEHVELNEEFQYTLYNRRTGSLISANNIVVSSEPRDVTSAQRSMGEMRIRGGATTLSHPSLLTLLFLMTFALYKQRL